MPMIATPIGVAYADESFIDRDQHGILWTRVPSRPGAGQPLYATVHPLRLRRAMRRLLCQVCANPADHHSGGTLWALPHDNTYDWSQWPHRLRTTHAPICTRCARISIKTCPVLRRRHLLVRAHSTIIGVAGEQYQPDFPHPRLVQHNMLARHDDPAIRWTKAQQLVRELRDCRTETL